MCRCERLKQLEQLAILHYLINWSRRHLHHTLMAELLAAVSPWH